ncbi:thioredoxin [Corynebacterium bovis]|uniref:Thioredoxin n=2 Tax=Corynebacterium bovis TaxID=36808 RepID=A0A3R8W161_9CORY|nr:thioredoxin [Corynebacterium bovis]MBB3115953.1 thioredoxin 1 [Corynebacterium bovis DSM 20582 = CIP 54.80]MDH2456789.1 thioredoxin [Corynebacterium bovis]MDK8511299.1 thioredoxin [Corynebacterium bovis]MDN8579910.1 thioredoxin [Corynebacterium bovis]QQC46910.1 thioredoxin [Corynebacterium bovis]
MASPVHVTQDTFRSTVVESDVPVLVDFWAGWCQPCLRMDPVLAQIAEEFDGRATVAKVNVDEQRLLASMFQVMSIPALLIFKDGKKVAELHGVQPKDDLSAKLDSLC